MTADVLAAARTVFLENGYKQTNVSQITKPAGIATGSFYKFYDSKQAIFLAVYDEENEKLRNELSQKLADGISLVEGANLIIRTVFESVRKNRVLMEWYRGDVGELLHATYQKKMADGTYGFNAVLMQWLAQQISILGLNQEQQEYLQRGIQFLNNLDQVLTAQTFLTETDTLALMVQSYLEKWVLKEN